MYFAYRIFVPPMTSVGLRYVFKCTYSDYTTLRNALLISQSGNAWILFNIWSFFSILWGKSSARYWPSDSTCT